MQNSKEELKELVMELYLKYGGVHLAVVILMIGVICVIRGI